MSETICDRLHSHFFAAAVTDINNKKMGLALRDPKYKLGIETDTPPELASSTFSPLSKLKAHRKVRKMALTMTQEE